jgi:hypothetical protein
MDGFIFTFTFHFVMKLMRDMYFTIYNREQRPSLPETYQRDKGCHKIHALINILF